MSCEITIRCDMLVNVVLVLITFLIISTRQNKSMLLLTTSIFNWGFALYWLFNIYKQSVENAPGDVALAMFLLLSIIFGLICFILVTDEWYSDNKKKLR